jgi:homoaconitase/3-isopropylmalate dehydratase large subunit
MNIAEHILARSAGRDEVAPGQIVTCELDLICIDEIQIPIFVVDHYCPPTSHHQATAVRQVRDFAVLTIKEFESAGVAGGAWRPLWPPRKGGM